MTTLPDRLLAYAEVHERDAETCERMGDTFGRDSMLAEAALYREAAAALSGREAVGLPVGRVQRGPAPHDSLYAMLLPTAPRTPPVKEGDLLYTTPQPGDGWRPIAEAPKGEYVLACNAGNWPNSVRWVQRVDPVATCDFADRAGVMYSGMTHYIPLAAPSTKGV